MEGRTMNAYVITSLRGQHEIQAADVAEALRTFTRTNPGESVLSIAPASLQRAAEQQA